MLRGCVENLIVSLLGCHMRCRQTPEIAKKVVKQKHRPDCKMGGVDIRIICTIDKSARWSDSYSDHGLSGPGSHPQEIEKAQLYWKSARLHHSHVVRAFPARLLLRQTNWDVACEVIDRERDTQYRYIDSRQYPTPAGQTLCYALSRCC
jgi:hypothetical protein